MSKVDLTFVQRVPRARTPLAFNLTIASTIASSYIFAVIVIVILHVFIVTRAPTFMSLSLCTLKDSSCTRFLDGSLHR